MGRSYLKNFSTVEGPPSALYKLQILLVEKPDADSAIHILIGQAYDKTEYSVIRKHSYETVIEALKSGEFDICLIDQELENTTGIELIRLLLVEGYSGIPIILMINTNSHEIDIQAANIGATDYLVKNQLTPELLERSIRFSRRQKETEEKVRYMAFYDPLTGLANRYLFVKYLDRSISTANRHAEFGALLLIDLDNFKVINDTHGHVIGDSLLVEISRRLEKNIRGEDAVARLGGDEFVFLFSHLSGDKKTAYDKVRIFIEKIRYLLASPISVGGEELSVKCSIGATLFCDDNASSDTLLIQVDIAMYRAKSDGKNVVRFFDFEMEDASKTKHWLEQKIHDALIKKQFELFYQPIVELVSASVVGVEALIRWRHPDRGLILPAKFMDTAEKNDLICEIGRFVISKACEFLKKSPALDYVSINISGRHFEKRTFSNELTTTICHYDINPNQLVIELTEDVYLSNPQLVRKKMNELRGIGLKFALDNFGGGVSSISALRDLPLNIVKMSSQLTHELGDNSRNDAVASAVIELSDKLGLTIVAKGVETSRQLEFLISQICLGVQGYYFSKPVTQPELVKLLESVAPKFMAVSPYSQLKY